MAGASLLTLIDDIATILDDVSVMTKVAAKKTAGLLGDDLALNAEQVTGVRASRELPVVWSVARGSLLNKAILIPAALLISAFMPWLVTVLLMLGGAFLCFEGAEKLAHKFLHGEDDKAEHAERAQALASGEVDMRTFERKRIKGAVRTDFILSAEIIVIALGTVTGAALGQQIVVLIGIGLLMTVGVYGLVAGIVKLDDLGFYLDERGGSLAVIGRGLVNGAPYLMKLLSVVGTLAMFLVGGGILNHGVPALHHLARDMSEVELAMPGLDAIVHGLGPMLLNLLVGLVAGALVLGAVTLIQKWRGADA
ncbi:DUF808 domain-containing protein [Halomonas elongata]|uniref:DUF808 domain-containing protein n=1 Tax=Halomonas elongata (strain ATCC 33173 / DSM 2581 / NBRC 15536 / NCIMB 2198 / 1H9) TaxID=768066 RepID=E1V6H4_HALED|nr:DUF808 domain-containing protein [Halomonas elongata]WBF18538.1 DUF808 domain-containing protein [Halomonas elongata]WPU47392.1 DUF808 domain-containing protein [Halomonas elongata DSM 2581]CBV41303.2 DUF808 family protein [Halomonas elongata DSM 2581]